MSPTVVNALSTGSPPLSLAAALLVGGAAVDIPLSLLRPPPSVGGSGGGGGGGGRTWGGGGHGCAFLCCQVDEEEVIDALVGTVVGLGRLDPPPPQHTRHQQGGYGEEEEGCGGTTIPHHSGPALPLAHRSAGLAASCLGLGFVTGVDLARDILQVVTPLPESSLVDTRAGSRRVNILMRGNQETPLAFLQPPPASTHELRRAPGMSEAGVPYCVSGSLSVQVGSGSGHMRSRNNIQRGGR